MTEPLAKEAASSYEIFLEGFAKIVIQLQLLMDHEAEQGENKYLSQYSVARVTTGLTNISPKVVFKLYNYYRVRAL